MRLLGKRRVNKYQREGDVDDFIAVLVDAKAAPIPERRQAAGLWLASRDVVYE